MIQPSLKAWHKLWAHWDKFWFAPQSPLPMAVFRILFGLLLIQFCILIQPDLYNWFGSRGIVSSGAVHAFSYFINLNVFNFVPDNDAWLTFVFIIFCIASVTLTIGYRTRLSATLVYLGICGLYHRDPLLFNSGDSLIRQITLWMPFSNAGDAYSIDQMLRNKKAGKPLFAEGPPSSPWAQRFLQVQLSLVYLQTFTGKTDGYVWMDGTAVYYSSRLVELRRFVVPYIFDNELPVKVITYMTLIIEASLATLVWLRPLRYWILSAGVCFHLMIDLNMCIPQFEWLMIVAYVLFIYPDDLRRWLGKIFDIITFGPLPAKSHPPQ